MKSIDNNAPIDVLRNFFFEMNQWESTFAPKVISLIENDAPQSEIDSTKAEAKKILIDIFDKFNITGKKNRNRIDGINFSYPPTYEENPRITDQVAENKIAIYFVQKQFGMKGQYKYTLKNKNEQWTLTKREFLDHEKKWRPFSF